MKTLLPPEEVSVHSPVMISQVLSLLSPKPSRDFLDLTVGGGGHAAAILEETTPTGRLVGIDRDERALEKAKQRLLPFEKRVTLLHSSFGTLSSVLSSSMGAQFDGALLDCGLSSDQLQDPRRGFSFSREGPLDMRMDPSQGVPVNEWLRRATEKEIADAIFVNGDERHSRKIAKAIKNALGKKALQTTKDLATLVADVIPRRRWPRAIHPATKTFQALRMVVNNEIEELQNALDWLLNHLPHQARILVISFHSAEDRLVKHAFRKAAKEGIGQILTPKPICPQEVEVQINPRARSAKLRALALVKEAP